MMGRFLTYLAVALMLLVSGCVSGGPGASDDVGRDSHSLDTAVDTMAGDSSGESGERDAVEPSDNSGSEVFADVQVIGEPASYQVDQSGGTFSTDDPQSGAFGVEISVPAGTFDGRATITVEKVEPVISISSGEIAGPQYRISSDRETVPGHAVIVKLPVTAVPSAGQSIIVLSREVNGWHVPYSSGYESASGRAYAVTEVFSIFGSFVPVSGDVSVAFEPLTDGFTEYANDSGYLDSIGVAHDQATAYGVTWFLKKYWQNFKSDCGPMKDRFSGGKWWKAVDRESSVAIAVQVIFDDAGFRDVLTPVFAAGGTTGTFRDLAVMALTVTGRPIIVGLSASGYSHAVLAYAYDSAQSRFRVYDPFHPGVESYLSCPATGRICTFGSTEATAIVVSDYLFLDRLASKSAFTAAVADGSLGCSDVCRPYYRYDGEYEWSCGTTPDACFGTGADRTCCFDVDPSDVCQEGVISLCGDGQCQPNENYDVCPRDCACVPDCSTVECGKDPVCGQDCGNCEDGLYCDTGHCRPSTPIDGMVLIPSSSFMMGCNSEIDSLCDTDEYPYHQVQLSAYYIDRAEVTQSQFKKCVDAGVCSDHSKCCHDASSIDGYRTYGLPNNFWGDNRPMAGVTWYQANRYCGWLGKRLPTEAEWEYAARGDDGRIYPWGNDSEEASWRNHAVSEYYDSNKDVCSLSPAGDSPFGLCDMAGNTNEWVNDWYSEDYTDAGSSDPVGPESGTFKVTRGGGVGPFSIPRGFRNSSRYQILPEEPWTHTGFRCAVPVDAFNCGDGKCLFDETAESCPIDCACQPDCTDLECGPDPVCGRDCGTCEPGKECQSGACVMKPRDPDMILIPAGPFWMGCDESVDSACKDDEKPYHQVTLPDFYIDRARVTVADYIECYIDGGCLSPATNQCDQVVSWLTRDHRNHPMNCVSWDFADRYCRWAGKRLPTEAEWEKAARGTDGSLFPWGNEPPNCPKVWSQYCQSLDFGQRSDTRSVCSSRVGDSPYGLCDMMENVCDWVSDYYDAAYFTISPTIDPAGPDTGSSRVLRGSCHTDYPASMRLVDRVGQAPENQIRAGFRCARDAD